MPLLSLACLGAGLGAAAVQGLDLREFCQPRPNSKQGDLPAVGMIPRAKTTVYLGCLVSFHP